MKHLLLSLFGFLLALPSFAQNLKGKVFDTHNETIAGASVYIKEIKQGLICNSSGEFRTTLPDGTYTCEFQCVGYNTQIKTIQIKQGSEPVDLLIILTEKDYNLKEVVIDNSGEDPAYPIMRKAIEKAPYYNSLVKEATYEAYIKGSGKALEIPKLMEKMAGEDLEMYKNKLFLQESYSEIKFTAPDHYEQTVKAFSSSMPNDFDPKDAMRASTYSLYSPMYGSYVSPLNPKALSHYKFRYEGYDEADGQIINKIRVIPKLKDSKFIDGYLYIADGDWNIRHAEFTTTYPGMTIRYDLSYNPVAENAYMVTSYTGEVDASMLGLKIKFNYLSSIKYKDIQLNDSLIAAEYQKLEKEKKKKEKKSLEIKFDDKFEVKSDSLATRRDSSFWAEVRNISLNPEETQSYIRKDTLQAYADSVKNEQLHPKFKPIDLLMGGRIGGDSSKVSFRYGGLVSVAPEYNFVDGFWLGQSVEFNLRRNKNSSWQIKPMVYWAWSREKLLWNADINYSYSPMKLGKLSISAGSTSEDYNTGNGMLRIENALNSLFTGVNIAKFYQKDYLSIRNEIDIINGLQVTAGVEVADRKQLDNHITYSFFGDEANARPNRPEYAGSLNEQYNILAKYEIRLRYRPEYYYRIENGKKWYSHSRFPTFELLYQQGVPSWLDNSVFYRLDVAAYQEVKLGLFDHLFYAVSAGKFFNTNKFNYIDYKHFNGADQLISGKTFESSYSLLDYYTFSTNENWVQAFATYSSQYLLLKRLPFLQGKMFSESLHGKFLHTPGKPYYSEWGYSVGIPFLGSIGTFVSFDSFEYNSFGVRVSIPLLKEVGLKK